MDDLDDVAADFRPRHGRRLTVATKYVNLTRRFFAGHGIADYRIVESLGATEGAPASGAADLIVDITTTGATLRANGLKMLADGVILQSEAHLVASLTAPWDDRAAGGASPPWPGASALKGRRADRLVRSCANFASQLALGHARDALLRCSMSLCLAMLRVTLYSVPRTQGETSMNTLCQRRRQPDRRLRRSPHEQHTFNR